MIMNKLVEKLLDLGYVNVPYNHRFFFKTVKCYIYIYLTDDLNAIANYTVDRLLLPKQDYLKAVDQLNKDLQELNNCFDNN